MKTRQVIQHWCSESITPPYHNKIFTVEVHNHIQIKYNSTINILVTCQYFLLFHIKKLKWNFDIFILLGELIKPKSVPIWLINILTLFYRFMNLDSKIMSYSPILRLSVWNNPTPLLNNIISPIHKIWFSANIFHKGILHWMNWVSLLHVIICFPNGGTIITHQQEFYTLLFSLLLFDNQT